MRRTILFSIILLPLAALIALIFLLILISRPINDNVAVNVVKELKQISLPEKTVVVEEKAIADRLSGNGDGVQYFGALLLKSELSLEELKEYYAKYSDDKFYCTVEHQNDSRIEQDELSLHQEHVFDTAIDADNYFILYSWGNYSSIFTYLDGRGIN